MLEAIAETKKCGCGNDFHITRKELDFLENISPVFNGERYEIPVPEICPDCRQRGRLAFRNERQLYKRKCDMTGTDIISIYSPDKSYKVYGNPAWWSDAWSPFDHSREFDFDRGFFEQFDELMKAVPKSALNAGNDNINSEYNNYISGSKDCYLNFGIENCENCFYSAESSGAKDSLGLYHSSNVQYSGYLDWSANVYNSLFVENSNQIANSIFIKGSKDIISGIFCVNVANMKYAYKNQEVGAQRFGLIYEEMQKRMKTHSGLEELKDEFREFAKTIPEINLEVYSSENCTGNLINNSHDCKMCFSVVNSDDCRFVYDSFDAHSSQDANFIGNGVSRLYDSINIFGCSDIMFSESVFENSKNILYSSDCTNNSSDLFGCVGLKNSRYCILNKQYPKERYEELVPEIIKHMIKIGEWGRFFPMAISPFGYNETLAMEYYPIKKEDVINHLSADGKAIFKWSAYENPKPQVSKVIPASKLPDSIDEIPDDIINWAIECESTGKPFRIIRQELEFYRRHNLPIPKRHPDKRHADRMDQRNPRILFDRRCDKCGVELKTTYSPERTAIVYCEKCFREEM